MVEIARVIHEVRYIIQGSDGAALRETQMQTGWDT